MSAVAIAALINGDAATKWICSPAYSAFFGWNQVVKRSHYSGADNLEAMTHAIRYNRFLTQVIENNVHEGDKIVDLGAGLGTFAFALRELGHSVHCVEPDAHFRDELERLGFPASPDIRSLHDGAADVIYSLNALEHIADDQGVLRQCAAKLRPTGRLIVYVPAFPVLFSKMDEKVGHLRRYKRKALELGIAKAGFQVVESRYVDSLGFLATLAYKLLDSSEGRINRTSLVFYDRLVFPMSQAVDKALHRWMGKNLLVIGRRSAVLPRGAE